MQVTGMSNSCYMTKQESIADASTDCTGTGKCVTVCMKAPREEI